MDQDLSFFASIPEGEVYEPTVEYWRGMAAKAHDTSWGLPDRERWICGLLKAWAMGQLSVDIASNAVDQLETLALQYKELEGKLEESEKQVVALRMQLGKAKKKLEQSDE